MDLVCGVNDRLVCDTELNQRPAFDALLAQASAHFLEFPFGCSCLMFEERS
jgi:hypothetical protein